MRTPDTTATTVLPTPADAHERTTKRQLPVMDILISLGLGALFANAFVIAMGWSQRAGLFPRMVTLLGVGLAILHVLVLLFRARRIVPVVEERVDADDEAEGDVEYIFAHATRRAWAASLAWVAAFFGGLYVVGLFVIAPIFSLAYLRFSGSRSWAFSLIYAVAVLAVLYLAFEVALQLQVPTGILF